MKVRVEHDAEIEALDAAWYYEQKRIGLSNAFLLTFSNALRSIGEFPHSYPLFRRGAGREFRFRLLKPFDYLIVFEIR